MQDKQRVDLIQRCRREKDVAQVLRWDRLWSRGSRHMRLLRGTEGPGHEAHSVPCSHGGPLHMGPRKSVARFIPSRDT